MQRLRGYYVNEDGKIRHPKVLKLIREPTQEEWQGFQEPVPTFGQMKQKWDDTVLDSDDELEIENPVIDPAFGNIPVPQSSPDPSAKEHIIPTWTPDRSLQHIIFDVIDQSGMKGISTMDVVRRVASPFFKRVVEITINKMADHWQVSQPQYLRHLAVVKDTALTDGQPHYAYYTFENFQELVHRGERAWEAVLMPEKKKPKAATSAPPQPLSVTPQLDEFGFPKIAKSDFAKPGSDPTQRYAKPPREPKEKGIGPKLLCVDPDRPKGRPRKYPTKGIPENLESWRDDEVRGLERSRTYSFQYFTKKAQDMKEALTATGVEPQVAEEQADTEYNIKKITEEYEALQRKIGEFMPFGEKSKIRKRLKNGSKQTRGGYRGRRGTGVAMTMQYLPSIAAHSQLVTHWEAAKPRVPNKKRPRTSDKITTPRSKRVRGEIDMASDLTQSNQAGTIQTTRTGRVIKPNKRLELDDELALEAITSTSSHTRGQDSIRDLPRITSREEHIKRFQHKDRTSFCVVGDICAKVPHGGRGRPRKSQLLRVKTNGLRGLAWFWEIEESIATAPVGVAQLEPENAHEPEAEPAPNSTWQAVNARGGTAPVTHLQQVQGQENEPYPQKTAHEDDNEGTTMIEDSVTLREGPAPRAERPTEHDDDDTTSSKVGNITGSTELAASTVLDNADTASSRATGLSAVDKPVLDEPSTTTLEPDKNDPGELQQRAESTDDATTATPSIGTALPTTNGTEQTVEQSIEGTLADEEDVLMDSEPSQDGPSTAEKLNPSEALLTDELTIEPIKELVHRQPEQLDRTTRFLPSKEKSPLKTPRNRLTVAGGSIALFRRKIVMDLINHVGGVSPDISALHVAFAREWGKRGQSGTPDQKTCKNAVKGLIDSGVLQRFHFGFETSQGNTTIKGMLVLSGIDRFDERVKELEKKLTALHPHMYYPEAWDIGDRKNFIPQTRQSNTNDTSSPAPEANETPLFVKFTVPNNGDTTLRQVQKVIERNHAFKKAQEMTQIKSFSEFTLSETYLYEALLRESGPAGQAILPNPGFRALRQEKKKGEGHAVATAQGMRRVRERLASIMPGNKPVLSSKPTTAANGYLGPTDDQQSRSQRPKKVRFAEGSEQEPAFDITFGAEESSDNEEDDLDDTMAQALPTAKGSIKNRESIRYQAPEGLTPWQAFKGQMIFDMRREIKGKMPAAHPTPQWNFVHYEPQQSIEGTFAGEIDMEGMLECSYFVDEKHSRYRLSTKRINPFYTPPGVERKLGDIENIAPGHNKQRPQRVTGKAVQSRQNADITLEALDEVRGVSKPRTRRSSSRKDQTDNVPSPGENTAQVSRNRTKIRRNRKNTLHDRSLIANFGEHNTSRLMAAVSIIRCLTGGIEQYIDWDLVNTVFPDYDQQFLNARWRFCKATYGLYIEKLMADFQDAFALTYETGELHGVNLDSPELIDWAYLTDWTLSRCGQEARTASGFLDLPAERKALDRLCTLEETSKPGLTTYYEHEAPSTLGRREANLNAVAWGVPLFTPPPSPPLSPTQQQQFDQDLRLLKSLIRANIVTSKESYDSALAHEKLSRFSTAMLDIGTKQLLDSRVISQENKSLAVPGRNYDINAAVQKALKKAGNPATLEAAVKFKKELDDTIFPPNASTVAQMEGPAPEMQISCLAEDHVAMVLLNFVANGRCKIRPINPPMEKWGLCEGGGYQTRKMDKGKLNFTVSISASETYVRGIPKVPPPWIPPSSSSLNLEPSPMASPCLNTYRPSSAQPLFPLWVDIHHTLIPPLWSQSVAAVFNTIMLRPGCSAEEIARVVKPALEAWEILEILKWGDGWGGCFSPENKDEVASKGKQKGRIRGREEAAGWMVGEWGWAALGSSGDPLPGSEV